MEAATAAGVLPHSESIKACDSWDEPPFPSSANRLRLMCSYGGRIVPRPSEKSLCYIGGETRLVIVDRSADRHSSLADVSAKISRTLLGGRAFSLKYQLPNEDLDSLISVATDEDLDNMFEEYDRIAAVPSSSRLRLFLFPCKPDMSPASSIGSLLEDSKSETWSVDALNRAMGAMGIDGLPRGLSSGSATVNCLLGLEDDSSVLPHSGTGIAAAHLERAEQLELSGLDSSDKFAWQGQEVHSITDSPMLDTASSFGSASSSPSLANLAPVRIRHDDRPSDLRITGLKDNFSGRNNPNGAAGGVQKSDGDFKEPLQNSQPQRLPSTPLSASSASTLTISPPENPSESFSSSDEKSDFGGTSNPPQQPPKPAKIEALIPDPSSRFMYSNATTDPKGDQPVSADPSYRVPVPATSSSGYQLASMLPEQFEQQQLHHQQQHYIPVNPHRMNTATGGVIHVPSYFPICTHAIQQPPQAHPYDPHIPMYYYPDLVSPAAKPAAPVPRLPVKTELLASLFRSAAQPLPRLFHVEVDQTHLHTGMGYHAVPQRHLSQSPAPLVNYGYELAAEHARPQIYYSQANSSHAPAPLCQPGSSAMVISATPSQADAKVTRAT